MGPYNYTKSTFVWQSQSFAIGILGLISSHEFPSYFAPAVVGDFQTLTITGVHSKANSVVPTYLFEPLNCHEVPYPLTWD